MDSAIQIQNGTIRLAVARRKKCQWNRGFEARLPGWPSVKQKARPSVEQKIRQRSSWAEGAARLLRERVGESTGSGSLQATGPRCSRGYRPHAGRSGRNEDGAPMSWGAAFPALAPLLHGAEGRHPALLAAGAAALGS